GILLATALTGDCFADDGTRNIGKRQVFYTNAFPGAFGGFVGFPFIGEYGWPSFGGISPAQPISAQNNAAALSQPIAMVKPDGMISVSDGPGGYPSSKISVIQKRKTEMCELVSC
ncbi:hypothetical protein PENTCL1PPCAC_18632, partial [Pristionchus entomophagus]